MVNDSKFYAMAEDDMKWKLIFLHMERLVLPDNGTPIYLTDK